MAEGERERRGNKTKTKYNDKQIKAMMLQRFSCDLASNRWKTHKLLASLLSVLLALLSAGNSMRG